MVETETTTAAEPNRLITFALDADETLLIRAGRGELDNRTIYTGNAGGRYAVVPVDELQRQAHTESDDEVALDLEGLQLVGETITLSGKGQQTVGLHSGGRQIGCMERSGAYGFLQRPSSVSVMRNFP